MVDATASSGVVGGVLKFPGGVFFFHWYFFVLPPNPYVIKCMLDMLDQLSSLQSRSTKMRGTSVDQRSNRMRTKKSLSSSPPPPAGAGRMHDFPNVEMPMAGCDIDDAGLTGTSRLTINSFTRTGSTGCWARKPARALCERVSVRACMRELSI